MSRRRSLLMAGAVLSASLGLIVPNSAHAATTACAGTGLATLSTGIGYPTNVSATVPPFGTPNVGFTFTFDCAGGGTVTGSGTLDWAACGQSLGTGSIAGVGNFDIATAGSMLVISGATHGNTITGGGNATPVPDISTVPPGNSCSNKTAREFLLVGAVAWA